MDVTGQSGSSAPANGTGNGHVNGHGELPAEGWGEGWSGAGSALEPEADSVVPAWRRGMDALNHARAQTPPRYAELLAEAGVRPPHQVELPEDEDALDGPMPSRNGEFAGFPADDGMIQPLAPPSRYADSDYPQPQRAEQPSYPEPPRYAEPPSYPEPPQYAETPQYAEAPQYPEPPRYTEPPQYAEPPQYTETAQFPDPPLFAEPSPADGVPHVAAGPALNGSTPSPGTPSPFARLLEVPSVPSAPPAPRASTYPPAASNPLPPAPPPSAAPPTLEPVVAPAPVPDPVARPAALSPGHPGAEAYAQDRAQVSASEVAQPSPTGILLPAYHRAEPIVPMDPEPPRGQAERLDPGDLRPAAPPGLRVPAPAAYLPPGEPTDHIGPSRDAPPRDVPPRDLSPRDLPMRPTPPRDLPQREPQPLANHPRPQPPYEQPGQPGQPDHRTPADPPPSPVARDRGEVGHGLPQRVPSEPDVPRIPEPNTEPPAPAPALSRIASGLRRDDLPPSDRPDGFDVATVLSAVRDVPGVRDAQLRATATGGHTLRLDLADGSDPAYVSRVVARMLNERMGLVAEPPARPAPTAPPASDPPASARPASGPPASGLPASARPASGPPASGPPASGPPASAARTPMPTPEPAPPATEESPRRPVPAQHAGPIERTPIPPSQRGTNPPLPPGLIPASAAPREPRRRHPVTMRGRYPDQLRPGGDRFGRPDEQPEPGRSPALTPPAEASRVVLDHVQVSTFGLDATVEVRLVAGERVALGVSNGPAVDGYVLRLCAAAAANAVDELLSESADGQTRGHCYVEQAAILPMGSCEVAVVVVLLVCDGWVEQLAGSALVSGDPRQAVVRATLAAVNRRLSALLP
ncbi:hypothetical protein AB0M47_17345 [Hamadaea sp. NPDC051192]|uniref:hypothetical protein n=1 Tax=Hamadaea sp. NPDC051192 TaxID=3154940 RepID=UPI0034126DB1